MFYNLLPTSFFAIYPNKYKKSTRIAGGPMNSKPKKLLDQVREHMRIRHLSMSTERCRIYENVYLVGGNLAGQICDRIQDGFKSEGKKGSVLDDQSAVNDYIPDITSACRINQVRDRVVKGGHMGFVGVDNDQIGLLALFKRPDPFPEADSLCPASGSQS